MRSPFYNRKAGAALVIVLSLLVLIAALAVAYFFSVETEAAGSAARKEQVLMKQLAELPLKIVETQIRAATTFGHTGKENDPVSIWTSQPGLLRVFNEAGDLASALKLYSSSKMEEEDLDFLSDEIPENWREQENRWVDMNTPIRSALTPDEYVWPILNPAAATWADGLQINADPSGEEEGAAMPVEWLYVLEDGSLSPLSGLTAENPPVGRIAFWADDESCKINVNTAGERTMWDRPRAWHEQRELYGMNQPSTGEFNAYPGHPATVSLSVVLGKALEAAVGTERSETIESILSMTPRYRWGGSEDGTKSIWDRAEDWQKGNILNVTKQERLYATAEEFLLSVSRQVQDERLKEALAESGFLLTAASRAPELNLAGVPRIGIWPIDVDTDKRSVSDQLIAHCLTIGDESYFFKRSSPLASDEATSITDNWKLLEYLDELTSRPVPGFKFSFEDKWETEDRRQILTAIFDYVRAGTNLCDTSRDEDEYDKQFTPALKPGRGFVAPTKIPTWDTRGMGRAPVITHVGVVLFAHKQEDLVKDPKKLPDYKTDVKALLWFNFFSPMHGLAPYSTRYRLEINGSPLSLKGDDMAQAVPINWKGTKSSRFFFPRNNQDTDWGGYDGMVLHEGVKAGTFKDYEFYSANAVTIRGTEMDMGGGKLRIDVFEDASGEKLQSYEIDIPSARMPVPLLWGGRWVEGMEGAATNPYFDVSAAETVYSKKILNPLEFHERPQDVIENDSRGDFIARRNFRQPPVDVIRTVELKDGDARLISSLSHVDSSFYAPGFGYFESNRRLTGSLLISRRGQMPEHFSRPDEQHGKQVDTSFKTTYKSIEAAILPKTFEKGGKKVTIDSLRAVDWAGDIDNGFLGEPDGPYANKPDEGHVRSEDGLPYYNAEAIGVGDGQRLRSWDPRFSGFFSPVRQTPSPVMFGSLPTRVKSTAKAYSQAKPQDARPWETLLFCPNSQAAMVPNSDGEVGHPGALEPKDHLLLDLFSMPVVEPYAISEPFSTAGKINLNQRIIPFTYIKRETGLHGVLKHLQFMAVPTNAGTRYRSGSSIAQSIRAVDIDATLKQFANILDPDGTVGAGAFKSASEICDIFLVPKERSENGAVNWNNNPQAFWQAHQLTGDNSREAPYNYIYPLLTTKSNTYQVHYRVETLKPLRHRSNFNPATDFVITGEQRGSYLLERYLDSRDPRFLGETPEVDSRKRSLEPFYQYRTLQHKRFIAGF